jgi:hypothetical protein
MPYQKRVLIIMSMCVVVGGRRLTYDMIGNAIRAFPNRSGVMREDREDVSVS